MTGRKVGPSAARAGRHRVSDIAAQAGLSRATVDRVLHQREGVRPETVAQVERALAELDRQHDAGHALRRVAIFDLVMQSPSRFSSATQSALEAELRVVATGRPARPLAPARASRPAAPRWPPADQAPGVGRRHPQGARPPARRRGRRAGWWAPGSRWSRSSPTCRRAGASRTSGVDNRSAGATAAYLITQWAGRAGGVLVTMSRSLSRNEEEREEGFRTTLAQLAPDRTHP